MWHPHTRLRKANAANHQKVGGHRPSAVHSLHKPFSRSVHVGRFTGLLGLVTFLALAYAFSTNRRAIKWKTVIWGLGLQIVFAFLVIKWTYGQTILSTVSGFITGLLGHSADGSGLVFGALGIPGNPLAVFAFAVLPTIIFV